MRRGLIALFVLAGFAGLWGWLAPEPVSPAAETPRASHGMASAAPAGSGAAAPQVRSSGPGRPVRVLREGRPLAGAEVAHLFSSALPATETSWSRSEPLRTDEAGEFALPRTEARVELLRVTAGDVSHLHVVPARLSTVWVLELGAAASLHGEVVNAEGRPLQGAALTFEPELTLGQGHPVEAFPRELLVRAASNEGGRFEARLELGLYQVRARASGHATAVAVSPVPRAGPLRLTLGAAAVIEGVVLAADGEPAPAATVRLAHRSTAIAVADGEGRFRLEVPAGGGVLHAERDGEFAESDGRIYVAAGETARGVALRLQAAGSVYGRVLEEGTGHPVSGALVDFVHGGRRFEARTDAQGTYLFDEVPSGALHLMAGRRGAFSDARVHVTPGAALLQDFELPGAGRIVGRVLTPSGASAAGARLSTPRQARLAVSGEDGSFALELGEGHHLLQAEADGAFAAVRVQVTPGADVEATLRLEPLATLRGVVTGNGAPAGGQLISLSRLLAELTAPETKATDTQGRFELRVPGGDYRLLVLPDHAGRPRAVEHVRGLAPGEVRELTMTIREPEEESVLVSGLVVEPDGAPAVEARVTVESGREPADRRRRRAFGRTDAAGQFEVRVPKAQFDLWADLKVLAVSSTGSAEIGAQPGARVTLNIPAWATLKGVVQGTPAPAGIEVSLSRADYPYALDRGSFAGAAFTMRNVEPGEYRVHVVSTDGRVGTAAVTVRSAATEVTVTLQAAGRVTGRVVSPDGERLGHTTVAYHAEGGLERSATSDADGNFRLESVPEGRGRLSVYAVPGAPHEQAVVVAAGETVDVGVIRATAFKPGTIGAQLAEAEGGVRVERVLPGSPAQRGGLKAGDLVLSAGGRRLFTTKEMIDAVVGTPGTFVTLVVRRDGYDLELQLRRAQ